MYVGNSKICVGGPWLHRFRQISVGRPPTYICLHTFRNTNYNLTKSRRARRARWGFQIRTTEHSIRGTKESTSTKEKIGPVDSIEFGQ